MELVSQQSAPRYAGFWIRVAAAIIDSLILGFVSGVAFSTAGGDPMQMSGAQQGVPLLAAWLYAALMESSSYQATLGKMALGLKVTDEAGAKISFLRATGRHFAKILSGILLAIGYIMVAFTKKKQGLHDLLAGTLVVRK